MEQIRNLETLIASWYKNLPHLPLAGQKWFANNAWWIVLVGVILGIGALFNILLLTFFAGSLLTVVAGAAGAVLGGLALLAALFFLAFGFISLILSAMAISPLKAGQKKGWNLLFMALLVNVASLVLSFLFSFNFFSLVWDLLMAAIGAYFLFEIRDQFAKKPTVSPSSHKK